METVEADYVVVGAGAMGMAFVDALTDHADVRVLMVDRRHAPGGHWLDAYPFVRLHQASALYGVASTVLGGLQVQQRGREQGLHERATAPEICAYYEKIMSERLLASGRVTFFGGCEWTGAGEILSRISGERHQVRGSPRVVDAHYLSPTVPACTQPPFTVGDGARVIPVNDLAQVGQAHRQYVIIGSGKTATDACIWLLDNGLDPDRICWVRPREPWMLDRARIQPDPATFIATAADVMESVADSDSPEAAFLTMEERGVLLRIDPALTPTMAKTPTLARWELDLLRTIEDVVRLGHARRIDQGRLLCDDGDRRIATDALVVHCAASGLPQRPLLPIWGPGQITLQPIRTGFPCFAASLAGFVEATIPSDEEKNRVCPSSPYSNTTKDWLAMQVLGARAAAAFAGVPEIKAWTDAVALNPARTPPELVEDDPDLGTALARLRSSLGPGLTRMAELSGVGR